MTGTHSTPVLVTDFSLEITAKDVSRLNDARHAIPQGTPVNITFLGSEDTRARVRAADAVREFGFQPVPHIAARRLPSRSALEQFLAALGSNAEHIVAVGGDPATPEGPYHSALEVIQSELLVSAGVRNVSIGGYPEGHPGIPTAQLWAALEHKCAALAEQGIAANIITQFGFDVDSVVRWLDELRQRGIDVPVRIGVAGPVGVRRLLSYASRFGVSTSTSITKKYGLSLTNLLDTARPHAFIDQLAERTAGGILGDVKLHFYTFGEIRASAELGREFADHRFRLGDVSSRD
jgi:methylenetetrahydrofolate reductase (NADPH)